MTDEPRDRETRPEDTGPGPEGPDSIDAPSKVDGPPVMQEPAEKKEPEPHKDGEKDGEKAAAAEPQQHFVGTGMFWGLVVGVLLAILVIVFASQNTHSATVKAIVWEWSSPIFVIVLISLLVGIVLDEIVGLLYRSRKRRRLAEKAELRRLRGKR